MSPVSSDKMKVGFIGLGRMGSLMARNILRGGFPVTVWNRTRSKAEELAKLGAEIALEPKALAEKTDVVISMLTEPSITEDVLVGCGEHTGSSVSDGVQKGKIVIDMSTNHPNVAKRIATHIEQLGADFLAAPVMGGTFIAEQAKLTILPSGKKEVVDRVTPVFMTMGQKVLYVGPTGTGMVVKLMLNLHLWVMMASYSESVVFASRMGINPKTLTDIFNNTVLKNYVTEYKAQKIVDDEWSAVANIDIAVKDLRLAMDVATDAGIPMPLGSLTKDMFTAAANGGLRDLDAMAVAILYGRLANEKISKLV